MCLSQGHQFRQCKPPPQSCPAQCPRQSAICARSCLVHPGSFRGLFFRSSTNDGRPRAFMYTPARIAVLWRDTPPKFPPFFSDVRTVSSSSLFPTRGFSSWKLVTTKSLSFPNKTVNMAHHSFAFRTQGCSPAWHPHTLDIVAFCGSSASTSVRLR